MLSLHELRIDERLQLVLDWRFTWSRCGFAQKVKAPPHKVQVGTS